MIGHRSIAEEDSRNRRVIGKVDVLISIRDRSFTPAKGGRSLLRILRELRNVSRISARVLNDGIGCYIVHGAFDNGANCTSAYESDFWSLGLGLLKGGQTLQHSLLISINGRTISPPERRPV